MQQTKTIELKCLSIFAHNVNGLSTKVNDLYTQVNAADFDVYLFTETRLNDSVHSCNLFPLNDYDVYRCDRSINTSDKKGGGGVLISVRKGYKSELILNGESNGCEQIWIAIKNKNKKNNNRCSLHTTEFTKFKL